MLKSRTFNVIVLLLLIALFGKTLYDYGYRKGLAMVEYKEDVSYQIGFDDGRQAATQESGRLAALYVNDQWELYIKHYCWDIDEKVEAALLPKDSQEDSTLKMCLWKKGEIK